MEQFLENIREALDELLVLHKLEQAVEAEGHTAASDICFSALGLEADKEPGFFKRMWEKIKAQISRFVKWLKGWIFKKEKDNKEVQKKNQLTIEELKEKASAGEEVSCRQPVAAIELLEFMSDTLSDLKTANPSVGSIRKKIEKGDVEGLVTDLRYVETSSTEKILSLHLASKTDSASLTFDGNAEIFFSVKDNGNYPYFVSGGRIVLPNDFVKLSGDALNAAIERTGLLYNAASEVYELASGHYNDIYDILDELADGKFNVDDETSIKVNKALTALASQYYAISSIASSTDLMRAASWLDVKE